MKKVYHNSLKVINQLIDNLIDYIRFLILPSLLKFFFILFGLRYNEDDTVQPDNKDITFNRRNMLPLNGVSSNKFGTIGVFLKGKKIGMHRNWHQNGQLSVEKLYLFNRLCSVIEYFKNGNIQSYKTFDFTLKSKVLYVTEFYDTGEEKYSGHYENGLKEGVWEFFNKDIEKNFNDYSKEYNQWLERNKAYKKNPVNENNPVHWIDFPEIGEKLSCIYENGEKEGWEHYYNTKGDLLKALYHKKGNLLDAKFYDEQGNLIKKNNV